MSPFPFNMQSISFLPRTTQMQSSMPISCVPKGQRFIIRSRCIHNPEVGSKKDACSRNGRKARTVWVCRLSHDLEYILLSRVRFVRAKTLNDILGFVGCTKKNMPLTSCQCQEANEIAIALWGELIFQLHQLCLFKRWCNGKLSFQTTSIQSNKITGRTWFVLTMYKH